MVVDRVESQVASDAVFEAMELSISEHRIVFLAWSDDLEIELDMAACWSRQDNDAVRMCGELGGKFWFIDLVRPADEVAKFIDMLRLEVGDDK